METSAKMGARKEPLSKNSTRYKNNPKSKLAVLTNMMAPYRIPIFSYLSDQFDLLVLHGGKEANRDSWGNFERDLPNASVVRAWGWQIRHKKKANGKVFDDKFIHITPGFISHLLQFQPDSVISSEMGFRSLIALAYGTMFRKPVWIWWEGTLHSERNIGFLRKVIRKVFSVWARHWITCGETSTEYLLSLGVDRTRILQSQNGVDEERFKAEVQPAWAIEPKPVLLHVGQLIERKGVAPFFRTAATLQQRGHEFSILLVGEGREKQALESLAQDLKLRNVQFQPAQAPENMPSVYRSADVVVFPTLEDVWGFVANEAILSGVPVLCSKYAGCAPELFSQENVFSPDNSEEFTEKLLSAISGQLPKADAGRLKTSDQLGNELAQELFRYLPSPADSQQNQPEPAIR